MTENLLDSDEESDKINTDQYSKILRSEKPDIIGDKYLIRVDLPMPQYDNDFAKAYKVDNLKNPDDKLYGLIYDSSLSMKIREINALKSIELNNMIQPVAAEVTLITSTDSNEFVIALPEPTGVTIRNYVKNNFPLSLKFIIDHIIFPITKVLHVLGENGISYGKINPDNIYLDPNNEVYLGECISETTGYSQIPVYEPMERLCVTKNAKASHGMSADYYSLGILVSFLFLGKDPLLSGSSEEEILREKIEQGSYNALIGKQNVPLTLKELIRGLSCDKQSDRWSSRHVVDWYSGKVYKPNISDNVVASQHLQFNNAAYYQVRVIAHDLFIHWDFAKRFLTDDRLTKWIEKSLNDSETSERVGFVLRASYSSNRNSNVISNDAISKVICVLDPHGPIRFKDISVHLGGIGDLIAYSLREGNMEVINNIIELVYSHPWKEVSQDGIFYRRDEYSNIVNTLEKVKMLINRPGLGFGVERALYALNHNLPCQSKMIKQYYITGVKTLLIALDKEAGDENNTEIEMIDVHIASYIAERMNINDMIKINSLKSYPDFYNDTTIKALALLSIAQKHTRPGRLVNLSKLCTSRLEKVIERLKNKEIKEEMIRQLNEASKDGMLIELYKIISNPGYIKQDTEGFERASKLYEKLQKQKSSLSNNKKIIDIGYRYGLRVSVITSYLLCSVMFIYLFSKYL